MYRQPDHAAASNKRCETAEQRHSAPVASTGDLVPIPLVPFLARSQVGVVLRGSAFAGRGRFSLGEKRNCCHTFVLLFYSWSSIGIRGGEAGSAPSFNRTFRTASEE